MGEQKPELITQSEFAKRKGVSPQAISNAIRNQRIGVIHGPNGKPLIAWEIASKQWDEGRRPRSDHPEIKARSIPEQEMEELEDVLIGEDDDENASEAGQYARHRAVTEKYKALRERQKYLQEKGELVLAADVNMSWSKITVATKTRIQAIPSKVKIAIPRLTPEEMEIMETLVDEALNELADWRLGSA